MSLPLFHQVFSGFPLVKSMSVFENSTDDYIMVGWKNKILYICKLSSEQISTSNVQRKCCNCEEIIATEPIQNVIKYNDLLLVIDERGCIYELKEDSVPYQDGDYDIFEDIPNQMLRWDLRIKCQFFKEFEVLSSCVIAGQLALLVRTKTSIDLYFFSLDSSFLLKKGILQEMNEFYEDTIKDSIMSHIPGNIIDEDFKKTWFSVAVDTSDGILLITLPGTSICAVVIAESNVCPHYLFSWPFKALAIGWTLTEEDSSAKKCSVIVAFDGGTIVTLGPYGGNTLYYPLNKTRSALIHKNVFFSTDFTDCYGSKISIDKCSHGLLPFKGLLGFCPFLNTNFILVSTKHGILYSLDIERLNINDDELFKMPEKLRLNELLQGSEYLEELSSRIDECDKYIAAMGLAIASGLFKSSLIIQVIEIAGIRHTLQVRVHIETPEVTLKESTWHIALSVSSVDEVITLVRILSRDVNRNQPLIEMFSVELKGLSRTFEVSASFVAYIDGGKYRPYIPAGNFHLNASHFIQPSSSLCFYKLHTDKILNIEKILKYPNCQNINSTNMAKGNENSLRICSMKIALNRNLEKSQIFNILLENSQALWRTAEWEELKGKDTFDIMLAGEICTVTIAENCIDISSEDINCCYQLKLAAIELLFPKFELTANENMLMEVENSLKELEILQYSQSGSNEKEQLLSVFKRKLKLSEQMSNIVTRI